MKRRLAIVWLSLALNALFCVVFAWPFMTSDPGRDAAEIAARGMGMRVCCAKWPFFVIVGKDDGDFYLGRIGKPLVAILAKSRINETRWPDDKGASLSVGPNFGIDCSYSLSNGVPTIKTISLFKSQDFYIDFNADGIYDIHERFAASEAGRRLDVWLDGKWAEAVPKHDDKWKECVTKSHLGKGEHCEVLKDGQRVVVFDRESGKWRAGE